MQGLSSHTILKDSTIPFGRGKCPLPVIVLRLINKSLRVMEVHVRAPMLLVQSLLPYLPSNGGRIINMYVKVIILCLPSTDLF